MLREPSLKFLHSMRERTFLEDALAKGLLFTDHKVRFAPTDVGHEFQTLLNEVVPLLDERLAELKTSWAALPPDRQQIIRMGLGLIEGMIPMLCFTEIPEGRDLAAHHLLFGGYGLVVSRDWLESNGADRVAYIGDNSPVSRHIFRVLTRLQVSNLFFDRHGTLVFRNLAYEPVLDLLAYVQQRANLTEFEWRIAGRHGFSGGGRDTGNRRSIPLSAIETVLVQREQEVAELGNFIAQLASAQSCPKVPPVLWQPATL